MPLDLLVPRLLLPADAPPKMRELRLPALERWLARADRSRRPQPDAAALLADAFSLPTPPPIAAISLAADDRPREGAWVRADPVHLRVDQDALALHHPATLEVRADEAAALVAALQSHFAADGFELAAPAPERWYAKVPPDAMPRTVPLEAALGRNVFGLLPAAAGGIQWPAALTEAQMLLAAHEVNARREAEGRPAINSVWFWGEGGLPATLASPYSSIGADDPFTRGLAILSRARLAATPRTIADVEAVDAAQAALVCLDAPGEAFRRGDAQAWAAAAERLDRDWFAELGAAIERFGAVRLLLPTGRDTLVAGLPGAARWRWLRRRKPLAAHA